MTRAETSHDLPGAARKIVATAAAGKGKPVYLITGEPFLVSTAAQALVDALVAPERRSMNLETYDGRATPLATVLDSARMPGFFGGAKLIWIREAPVLSSAEKRGDALAKIVDAVKEGRMEAVGGRLLSHLASADCTQEDFDTRRISEMPKKILAQAFGDDVPDESLAALDELQAWARERGMRLAAAADASDQLLNAIDGGLPAGVVLLFTAESVDSRKRVVKRLREMGEAIELTIERERSGAMKAESATAVIDRIVASHGKKLVPAARSQLLRLAGGDAAALASEVEKLCLYVGDAPAIGVADVQTTVRDLGEAWIFDLTDALAGRDTRRALLVLRGLLDRGDHPLRLLATLHSHVRLLLILRECLDGPWRSMYRPGMRMEAFKDKLVPALFPEEQAVLKGIHPYRLVVNTGQATKLKTPRLRRALTQLAELDLKFKSSRGDPAILLESFVMDLCR
jgi:DNA polymerase III subunit delta